MGMVAEFREFIQKGNVVDMAVGVIMGAAFGKIVNSVVADVIMPPVGLATGGVDFRDLRVVIGGTPEAPVSVNYGIFIQTLIDFLVIAVCVFFLVKAVNTLRRPSAADAPGPTLDQQLLTEIRDTLKRQAG
ncbi:Large-conductance mechanosensitive channel [Myxococcaceae bacterium]|jgi:large conductance mechanosensitive channel|nr:Large-conductance mechanosensitive channel [Myxococcaceae bacterium]